MDHKCNKALISNENRSYLKERRPKTRKIKKRFHYKYNLIGRAFTRNSAALISCFNKNHWSHFIPLGQR